MNESVYRPALRITLIYAVAAALWILTSDWLLFSWLKPAEDQAHVTVSSILKGLTFVTVTSFALYFLVRSTLRQVCDTEARMHLLFSGIDDSIYLFLLTDEGVPGNLIDANEALSEQLGHSRDSLLSRAPVDFVSPEDRPEMLRAIEQLWKEGSVVFEATHVSRSGQEIPVEICARTMRIGRDSVAVAIARDLTPRRREEAERREALLQAERDKRRFYRETIYAVTHSRFLLGEEDEAPAWVRGAEFSAKLPGAEQLSDVRHRAIDFCRRKGLSEARSEEFELAVGEALANAVKHAGGGFVYAGLRDGSVWVAVVDHGAGMDTFTIPKIALVPGFTTKASLGLGFMMMLSSADTLKLATSPEGTTVCLEKALEPQPAEPPVRAYVSN